MLMYVTSWEEPPSGARKAWKGYNYETLDALLQDELIASRKANKAVLLTDQGVATAKALLKEYGIQVVE